MDANTKAIPLELHPMGFIEAFVQFGAKMEPLLEHTGINPAMFGVKGIKISFNQQKKLIKNGVRLCGEPGLGLKVGMNIDWSYNGSVGGVVTCSPTLKDAGAAMRRYLPIAQPHYALYAYEPNFYIDENGLLVSPMRLFSDYNPDDLEKMFQLEYRLAVTLRLLDACGNKSVPDTAVRVKLEYPEPGHSHLYRELPADSIEFGCIESSVASHYRFVVEPWRELRRPNFEKLIAQCEKELEQAKIETTFTAKVRWHVSLYFNEQVTLEEVADILSMTPRALTRKLASENQTFRGIVQEVRMAITVMHLRSSHLSVDEIADLMRFSSASSLRRAVKNWSGETVGELRAASA